MFNLAKLCQDANTRHSKTVHSISVHLHSRMSQKRILVRVETVLKILKEQIHLIEPGTNTPKIGIMLSTPECPLETNTFRHANYITSLRNLGNLIDLVFIDTVSTNGLFDSIGTTSSVGEAIQWLSNEEKQCKAGLQKLWNKENLQFAILTGWPDTSRNNQVNFTNLVSFWEQLLEQSRQSGSNYIMHKAFDTPYDFNIFEESRGWWRLQESPTYNSPMDYIFEDKQQLSQANNTALNLTWINTPANFNTEHVGIWLTPIVSKTNSKGNALAQLMQASGSFNRLVVDSTSNSSTEFIIKIAQMNKVSGKSVLKTILVYDNLSESERTNADRSAYFTNIITNVNNISKGTLDIVLSKLEISTNLQDDIIQSEEFLTRLQGFTTYLKVGLILPIRELCLEENNTTLTNLSTASIIGISVQTNWLRLVANVDRYLSQFLVLLELCQNRLKTKQDFSSPANESPMIMYFVDWVDVNVVDGDYKQLANFVKFWEGLNNWTKSKKNVIVILGDGFDSMINGEKKLGWWSTEIYNNSLGHLSFEDKKTVVRDLYQKELHRKSQTRLESKIISVQIPAIVISIVTVVVIMGIIQSYLWKRGRLYQVINKKEVGEFFNGRKIVEKPGNVSTNHVSGIGIPLGIGYNKARYEINQKNFKIGKL